MRSPGSTRLPSTDSRESHNRRSSGLMPRGGQPFHTPKESTRSRGRRTSVAISSIPSASVSRADSRVTASSPVFSAVATPIVH